MLFVLLSVAPSFCIASTKWKQFTIADGLPSNRILCLAPDSDNLWVGTDHGLVLLRSGKMQKTLSSRDGLAGNVITSLALDANTGDLWVGTFGGVSRISGGTIESFTGLDSGLANDVVYDVAVQGRFVWAATAAGLSRFDNRSKTWATYNDRNSPMVDPWPSKIVATKETVYVGSWGAGVIKFDSSTETWSTVSFDQRNTTTDSQRDRNSTALFIHGLALDEHTNTVWSASQVGLASSSGEANEKISPSLPSTGTIHSLRIARDRLWVCTDEGLLALDLLTPKSALRWVGPIALHSRRAVGQNPASSRIIPEHQVFDVAFRENQTWIASAAGLWVGENESTSDRLQLLAGGQSPEPSLSRRGGTATQVQYLPAISTLPATVNLGLLAPLDNSPDTPFGIAMLHGAELAVEEANARNTEQVGSGPGRWFYVLKAHNDSAQWGAGTMEPVKMVQDEKAAAILGSFDGSATHTLLRISAELGIPVINTAATDPTIKDTGTPWLVTLPPDDRQQSMLLIQNILGQNKAHRLGILREDARYARVGSEAFTQLFNELSGNPIVQQTFESGNTDFSEQLKALKVANIDALLLWCAPDQGALILTQMQAIGLHVPAFGPNLLASPKLISLAGPASEGFAVVDTFDNAQMRMKAREFEKKYIEHFGEPADAYAAYAYDGVNLLIAAIEKAGIEPQAIVNTVADLYQEPIEGVSGNIEFAGRLNNTPRAQLSRVVQGRFVSWSFVLTH